MGCGFQPSYPFSISSGSYIQIGMRRFLLSAFIVIISVTGCINNQNNKLIGVDCFELPEKHKFNRVNEEELKQYNRLKDSVFKIPHAPLHKVIVGPANKTFVGLYHRNNPDSIAQKLSKNPYKTDQRQDTLGYHYLFRKEQNMAYSFLYNNPKGQMLLFLNISSKPETIKELFTDKAYYPKQLDCGS